MAKITRKLQKIFGEDSGAQGVTTYGSPASGTPVYSKDLDEIQTTAWDGGWASAALSGTEIPTFQDFNAIHYTTTSQIAYLGQMGVFEWDTAQDYYTGSITNVAGVLYRAVQDNTGENPSTDDGSNWLTVAEYDPSSFPTVTPADDDFIVITDTSNSNASSKSLASDVSSLKAIGEGQAWTDVTASRSAGTTYTNSTGKPIKINIHTTAATNSFLSLDIEGSLVSRNSSDGRSTISEIIPDGDTYEITVSGATIQAWWELR